ncbi:hypothetical protein TSUD_243250 [Trifolium subterraneum]|uniref:Uncharacterized protein n=1 Tax=Trifolium subterraneum TaxID=3900 RepID=A0A2Z6NLX1_TRISU|nr:hypothetical protein TSUD_243250 [Trifolium subterraneum]
MVRQAQDRNGVLTYLKGRALSTPSRYNNAIFKFKRTCNGVENKQHAKVVLTVALTIPKRIIGGGAAMVETADAPPLRIATLWL